MKNSIRMMVLVALVSLTRGGFGLVAPVNAEGKGKSVAQGNQTFHRTVTIDGVEIFYHEAGSRSNPTILLLHGFPASSRMFRNLIPVLADRFHLVAPDYPGYGNSEQPPIGEFDYTFERLSEIMVFPFGGYPRKGLSVAFPNRDPHPNPDKSSFAMDNPR